METGMVSQRKLDTAQLAVYRRLVSRQLSVFEAVPMLAKSDHLALHPQTHVCGHCEDPANPVTPESGMSITYQVTENLDVEVFVHRFCANSWSREFSGKLPARIKSVPDTNEDVDIFVDELRARLANMSDAELLRYGSVARYACSREGNDGASPLEANLMQLEEARSEWNRRKRGTVLADSF
jgi:hypothetical protein